MADALPDIEFWFEFGSNYSYLSVMRIEDAARRRNVQIVWQPFLLGPIFRALGMENSPFVLQKEKGAYVWHDMARQCRKYGCDGRSRARFPGLACCLCAWRCWGSINLGSGHSAAASWNSTSRWTRTSTGLTTWLRS